MKSELGVFKMQVATFVEKVATLSCAELRVFRRKVAPFRWESPNFLAQLWVLNSELRGFTAELTKTPNSEPSAFLSQLGINNPELGQTS